MLGLALPQELLDQSLNVISLLLVAPSSRLFLTRLVQLALRLHLLLGSRVELVALPSTGGRGLRLSDARSNRPLAVSSRGLPRQRFHFALLTARRNARSSACALPAIGRLAGLKQRLLQ